MDKSVFPPVYQHISVNQSSICRFVPSELVNFPTETVVEAGHLNAYACLKPSLLSGSELVDRLVDDLEDFARPVEPIPVFPGEFFEYSVIFELSDQSVGRAVFDI